MKITYNYPDTANQEDSPTVSSFSTINTRVLPEEFGLDNTITNFVFTNVMSKSLSAK